jgi:hypothetical protein
MFSVRKCLEDAGFKIAEDETDYVICSVDLAGLVSEADRCSALLGPDYLVQASYSPGVDIVTLFVAHKDDLCECGEDHDAPAPTN